MKQTKLREPILYTSLWVVSIILTAMLFIWYIKETWIIWLDIVISAIYMIVITYFFVWWFISSSRWFDRDETRDMKKYILWKIKFIDQQIADLQEEKEDLLYSDENK